MAEVGNSSKAEVAGMIEDELKVDIGRIPAFVGATGHRVIPPEDATILRSVVKEQLCSITKLYPDTPLVLITALAEGADRLVAGCALELGWKILAVLPLAKEDYEVDFETQQSVAEFRDLVARATCVKLIDPRYHVRPTCYEYLGYWIGQHAQLLLALWDGLPARGPGGTAHVVSVFCEGVASGLLQLREGGPVIHIQTRRIPDSTSVDNPALGAVQILAPMPRGATLADLELLGQAWIEDQLDDFCG